MKSFFSILLMTVFVSCQNSNQKPVLQNPATVHATEDDAIKKAVADAYKAISFKKGEKLNFDAIKDYFIPQAQLLNFRSDSLEILTIDQFVKLYKTVVESNGISSFYEEEMKGSTDQFGRVAQRISSYKTYINSIDSITEKGVNSFQLIKTAQGWKVSSIIWDVESARLTIPDYYLKSDSSR